MPNSLRSRISKLAYKGHISEDDARRIRDALEKQIPKKFVLKTTKMGISTWGCPNCGSAIVPHPNVTWCDWCGQKIDMNKEVE